MIGRIYSDILDWFLRFLFKDNLVSQETGWSHMLQTFDKDFYSLWPSFWNPWMMGWYSLPPSISEINFMIKPPLKSISPNHRWDVYFIMYFTTPSCWPLLDIFEVIMGFSKRAAVVQQNSEVFATTHRNGITGSNHPSHFWAKKLIWPN